MSGLLFAGTAAGLHRVSVADGTARACGMADKFINHIAVRGPTLLAACPVFGPVHNMIGYSPDEHKQEAGLYAIDVSRDGGDDARLVWRGNARSCAIGKAKSGNAWYIGAEPADVFKSSDHGATWSGQDGFVYLNTRPGWTWPAEPHDPHVLSIDFANNDDVDDVVVAGVEVGGILLSNEGATRYGESNDSICVDVHFARPDPFDPKHWLAVTGGKYKTPSAPGGLYRSKDGGTTWQQVSKGLPGVEGPYMTALAWNPHRRGEVLLCTADRPPHIGVAGIFHSTDAGATWHNITQQVLKDAGDGGKTTPVPYFSSEGAFLGLETGAVLFAEDAAATWRVLCRLPSRINTLAADGLSPSSVMH